MRTIVFLFVATLFMMSSTEVRADTTCGSAGYAWPNNKDGSIRLTYKHTPRTDSIELVHREKEEILLARGYLRANGHVREVYNVYDLTNGNLIDALAKLDTDPKSITGSFPSEYSMQSLFDVQVYAVGKDIDTELKALIAQHEGKACQDEVAKMSQGRTYDREKCDESIKSLNKILKQFVRPETATFTRVTDNVQVKKYIDKLRSERAKNFITEGLLTNSKDPNGKIKDYCIGIETMDMKIVDALRNPETQKDLAVKKKKPDYLD